MVLWKLMVRPPARRLCFPELILSSTVPILSFYSPEPLKKLLSSPEDSWALSYPPPPAPPTAPHHSPAEQRHRPAVTPSLMAGAMKHWYCFYGKPLVSCPKGLDFCNKEAALHHMNALQLLAILIINVRTVFITLLSAATFWPSCSICKADKTFKTWFL